MVAFDVGETVSRWSVLSLVECVQVYVCISIGIVALSIPAGIVLYERLSVRLK